MRLLRRKPKVAGPGHIFDVRLEGVTLIGCRIVSAWIEDSHIRDSFIDRSRITEPLSNPPEVKP